MPGLPAGTNLAALELHQFSPSNTMLGFDLELIGTGFFSVPPPTLSITRSDGRLLLSWPMTDGAGYTLYSTTNLAATGQWTVATSLAQTNSGQIVVTQTPDLTGKFFRLQKP
jgi:hypothetical protein